MTDAETISVYDAKAAEYASMVSRVTPDADLQAFMATLPPQATVLDWGCGPGNSAGMIAAAGHEVTATDASGEMVALARSHGAVTVRQETFDALSVEEHFDGIWANFSLLHASRAAFPGHLAQAKTALKPGGVLHLGMKTGTGTHRDSAGRLYTYHNQDSLEAALKTAGFTDLTHRTGETTSLVGGLDPFVIFRARA